MLIRLLIISFSLMSLAGSNDVPAAGGGARSGADLNSNLLARHIPTIQRVLMFAVHDAGQAANLARVTGAWREVLQNYPGNIWAEELRRNPNALPQAARVGNIVAVQGLLDAGANINQANHRYRTPLTAAVSNSHTETILVLIAAGANVNLLDRMGDTPLTAAVSNSHTETILVLIAAGANVNPLDRMGRTPLFLAAITNNAEAVRALIAAGSDVNSDERYGYTSLSWAFHHCNTEIMRLLIAARARQNCGCSCVIQ
ncbi:MAG: ankyrin repeat domain-containing protein [Deltaproteobacteria bacterium]|nr:ankyrin repeat domain-containing protein [Deltaproteobacteria bacterium]